MKVDTIDTLTGTPKAGHLKMSLLSASASSHFEGPDDRQSWTSNLLLLHAPITVASVEPAEESAMLSTIRRLPAKQRAKLASFVEDLRVEAEWEEAVKAAPRLSERALSRAWDNPEDARYNDL